MSSVGPTPWAAFLVSGDLAREPGFREMELGALTSSWLLFLDTIQRNPDKPQVSGWLLLALSVPSASRGPQILEYAGLHSLRASGS